MPEYNFTKIGEVEAVGGPNITYKDENGHPATPTKIGRFVVWIIGKYANSSLYPFSSGLQWGTPLRVINGKAQIKKDGRWINLSSYGYYRQYNSPDGERTMLNFLEEQFGVYKGRSCVRDYQSSADLNKKFPDSWIYNDFGHVTIQYFRDTNSDYILDGKETLVSDYIHTTPQDEYAYSKNAPFKLGQSHGCIHVRPADIDFFINNGYVERGSVIEVKSYSNMGPAPDSFRLAYGKPPYELHFYPGLRKIFIYNVSMI